MPTFHLDLRHLADAGAYRVHFHGQELTPTPHTEASLADAASAPWLAALPAGTMARFSHHVTIDDQHFPPDAVRWLKVVRPAPEGVHLHTVVQMAQILPEGHLRAYFRRSFELGKKPMARLRAFHRATAKRRFKLHSGKLASLGLDELPEDQEQALDLLVKAQQLVTPLDTASAFVAHHPDLANVQPYTAALVLNGHILPDPQVDPGQYNAMQVLATAITNAGDAWSPVVPCKDKDGNPLQAQYDLDGITTGQQLYTYDVDPHVLTTALPATSGARRTAQDDGRLSNKLWTPTRGTTALPQSGAAGLGAAAASYQWTVQEQTNMHGIGVDASSITIDPQNNFAIDASNSYLRTLYTSYQLYDDAGNPIGDETLLTSVSATNTILGIPVPTDPTQLAFNLGSAASVTIYFGSLGTSNWRGDVSGRGALLTGLWQYGVPMVFLVAGKAITSTAWFNKIVNDPALREQAIKIMATVVGVGVPTAAALANTKKVLFAFADVVLSIVLQKGMEKLGTWLVEQVGEGQLAAAFGPVGWALKLIGAGLDFEEMAVTTGEVLSSPACIEVTVKRAIDVNLTLKPDPRHGAAGDPNSAVWPSIGQRYQATLAYKDGTNFVLQGALPATTSGTPLQLTYSSVPAGGQFRIIAGIYSDSGWLCGKYQSDWITAEPNDGSALDLPAASITELLVPLAGDSQYRFKERIVYASDSFAWSAAGGPPTATLADLSCGNSGTLCSLVDITLNNSAFQVGYAWRSSGQGLPPDDPSAPPSNAQLYALQSLSVLASPGETLIASSLGLTDMPAIAYAPSYDAKNEIDQNNFVLDPRNGGMNLRQVTLTATGPATTFDLASGQSWGSFPLRNVDALAIHPNNAAIACSWQEDKLMILALPDAAVPDADAPTALLVSGQGLRQGLTQGPKAMAVAPDGRLLVLESTNLRVQAFDTKGNPVSCFTPGHPFFNLTTLDVAADLDAGNLPDAFAPALVASQSTLACVLDASFIPELDGGTFSPDNDPLILALSQNGILLAYNPQAMDDPDQSAQITVLQAGQSWRITDPRGMQWQLQSADGLISAYYVPSPTQTRVQVQTPGSVWLVQDQYTGTTWKLEPSTGAPDQTEVYLALSFFPLRQPRLGTPTYLDLAVESQGYVYVLCYSGDGTAATDYMLDIYAPDGTFVSRTPDPSVTSSPQNVAAGRLAVDIWRNVYALTYETLTGPNGDPQPGIAHWTPTPPLFSLDLTLQPDFNRDNISVVAGAFAAHGVTLSSKAFITTQNLDGAWTLKDGTTVYHVYRSGDGLQVYSIPA